MIKINTAEKFIEDCKLSLKPYSEEMVLKLFAKAHVRKALEEIYEDAKHGDEEHQKWLKDKFNNYSLENIK